MLVNSTYFAAAHPRGAPRVGSKTVLHETPLTNLIERNAIHVKLARPVDGIDSADCAETRPHDHVLRGLTTAEIVHSPEQLPVGYARGGEKDIVTADEVAGTQNARHVDAMRIHCRPLFV